VWHPITPELARTARWAGLTVALVGGGHVLAWLAGSMAERGIHTVTTKANAALCLLMLGTSLALVAPEGTSTTSRALARILAASASLVGLLTLAETAFGWDLGIDQIIAVEPPGAIGSLSPNRMGTPVAVAVPLAGAALILLSSHRRRHVALAQTLGIVVFVIALLSTLSHLYGVRFLYGMARLSTTALPAALSLAALGLGLLAARPTDGVVAAVVRDDPGGASLRRLLPPIVLLPVAAGWLRLAGERQGWYDAALGTALVMVLFVVSYSTLAYVTMRQVSRGAAALGAAHHDLEERQEELGTIVENVDQGIIVADRDGRLRLWNRRALEMHGFGVPAEGGRSLAEFDRLFELKDMQDRVLELEEWPLARILRGERLRDVEVRVRRREGDWERVYSYGGSLVPRENGEPAMAVLTISDATQRKQAELELHAARAAAEEASRAKDQFIAVLSHELRTPLTPVLMGVALLEADPRLAGRSREMLEVMRRNVELESRLIDDLLDVTRGTHGKVLLQRRRVALCTVIDRAVETCRPDIEARRLHFGVDLGPRPYLIDADPERLQQVFWNVLKNAVKFTPPGGCLGVRCRPHDGHAVVDVVDSGAGIDPAELDEIFAPFVQAHRGASLPFAGLGLGLTIARSLIELHGGTIEARSEGIGKGATFRVRLPILSHGAAEVGLHLAATPEPPRLRRALRILLVDDHGDTAETMAMILQLEGGHRVRTAGEVAQALDILSTQTFDVLISDLGLPDRSGLELVREMRSRGDRTPAIAISGFGQEADLAASRAAGFGAHLVKPVDPRRLLEAIVLALPAS
jgi:PAS domain S-box-containing protein